MRAAEAKGPGAAGDDSSGAQAAPTAAGDARAGQPASAAATQPRDADTAAQAGPAASEKQTGAAHDAQTEPFSDAKDSSDTAAGAASSAASPNGAGVLIARQSPVLGIETLGPRRITVGKASTYQLTVRNSGQVAAEQVVVTVGLPEWAEVSGTSASQGATVPAPPSGEGGGLLWQVGRLEAAKSENLVLQIVPRQSKPIDLAVKCDYTTAATQAVIEVQEPRLEVRLDGPREVLFGQREMYRLEVTNSGTGDAENVEIALTPLGTGNSTATTHRLGTVKAGDKKTIEVELTARQTGTLTIQVEARSDSGVQARLAEQIAVLRPDVQIEVTAPELQFVGTEATCRIRVANSGTAAAKEVTITATIPPQAKFVSCTSGGKLAADHSRVTWMLDTLEVGAEATLGLTCRLAQAGLTRFEAACSAAGGLAASAQAAVQVEAIADLALDVTDPAGPVPVSEEATYQVRVQNRGTKGAEEVEVVAYFSNGIEPVSAEGAKHQTAPGQVTFEKISSLAAGQDLTLRIKAKAEKPGHHVCRVEVYCKTLGTRLVSEETTYFYGKPGTSPPDAASQATGSQPASAPTARTADQRPAASALPASK